MLLCPKRRRRVALPAHSKGSCLRFVSPIRIQSLEVGTTRELACSPGLSRSCPPEGGTTYTILRLHDSYVCEFSNGEPIFKKISDRFGGETTDCLLNQKTVEIMKHSKQYHPVNCLKSFGLFLTLITALSTNGQTQPENLTIECQSGHPRLQWQGERNTAYEIRKTSELNGSSMEKRFHITRNNAQLVWSDEAASGSAAFYRVVRKPEDSLSATLQDRLNSIRGAWGVQAAIIIPGQGMWMGASGRNSRAQSDSIDFELRFSIGAITQTFVAAVITQLAEEGALTLEDTLDQWLPDLVHEIYRPADVTIRQLLGHRSGILGYTSHPEFRRDVDQDPTRQFTPEELVA